MSKLRIGFVGAGQMAKALASGLVRNKLVEAAHVLAYDPHAQTAQDFQTLLPGARLADSNAALVEGSDVVVLAVKPQSFTALAKELSGKFAADKLVVSILTGITLAHLAQGLGHARVVRVMPNTPCLVGKGASGFACGEGCSKADEQRVGELLGSVGVAHSLPEHLLDAVTGLSGSGPAYVYLMIEALADGGVRMGLPRATAAALAAQTVLGAAEMVLTTQEHPAVLKDRVTSPGGTTIAGLQVLEQQALRGALMDAVEAATKRAQELGK